MECGACGSERTVRIYAVHLYGQYRQGTANVDPENEAELTEAIEALTKEKTIIMIAHRLKTVRHADQIFVIDNGRIAQSGTHEELLNQEGIYKNFVEGRRQAASWKIASL